MWTPAISSLTMVALLSGMALTMNYPQTQRIEHTDDYFGVKVADPYRWLEDDVRQSPRVREWVDAQNKLTFDYLGSLPQRPQIKSRITELWDYDKYGTPFKRGGRYYMSIARKLENHAVIYRLDTLDGEKKVLFNPNTWSKDGTVALAGMSFTDDGKYVAYAIQDSGSDWQTWKIRDIAADKDLPDVMEHLKFTAPAWNHDSSGFYYAKYPEPDASEKFTSLNTRMKLMYHKLGAPQAEDTVVFYQPEYPDWGYNAIVTDDGCYLVVTIWVTTDNKFRIMVQDLQQPDSKLTDLIDRFENNYAFVDNDGPIFYFRTDLNAPNGRLIAIDLRNPDRRHWKEIIPESADPLQDVDLVNDTFVCSYLHDVTAQFKLFAMDGKALGDIRLPGPGTASTSDSRRHDTELFYQFQSMTTPPGIYRYDMKSGRSKLLIQPQIACDLDEFTTEQVFYTSKDGTRIPMFLAYKKTLKRDGANPTLLYGYGGYEISVQPTFSATRMAWLEMGGIFAIANIRGGGEYGTAWHEAGKKMQKQNVFDDFIAAGEYLIAQNYTSPKKLAIMGGSNGGLLVGACMTQRPDLFAAAIPEVGVMDMLRYDAFTAGRFWIDEYGSAKDNKDMFEYLKAYSPYHTLKPGTTYPATMVMTADTDDRVVPSHSFKFAAMLQSVHKGDRPVLIRIETRAGHGSGKPTSKRIEEIADIYTFLSANLGATLPKQ